MDGMGGMDMGGSSSSSSSSDTSSTMMTMVFHNNQIDSLFSLQWTPKTTGQYAGTCIFLIVFAVIYRLLHSVRSSVRRKQSALYRRVEIPIVHEYDSDYLSDSDNDELTSAADNRVLQQSNASAHAEKSNESTVANAGPDRLNASKQRGKLFAPRPWRITVDGTQALLQTVISGVGYLLMIAVMTCNVGYFLSVVGGIFLGELIFARYA